MGVFLRRFLDHGEEARLFFLAVDDEGAAENLVPAVLGVDLCEAENLAVGERTVQFFLHFVQIFNLFGRQGETLALVVFLQVFHVLDGLRLDVHGENVLVQTVVHALQHGVVVGILALGREIFLDAGDAFQAHVLRYLHGIGAPRGNHFAARTHEEARQLFACQQFCLAIKPT